MKEELLKRGQSNWLDYHSGGLIQSDELERLVEEAWGTGVTSNLTILRAQSPVRERSVKRCNRMCKRFVGVGRGRALFREAEDWILDEENDYIYSFWNSCEGLGLDAHYLRCGLLRWKEIKLRKTPKVRASPGSRGEPEIAQVNRRKNECRLRIAAK